MYGITIDNVYYTVLGLYAVYGMYGITIDNVYYTVLGLRAVYGKYGITFSLLVNYNVMVRIP